MSDDFWGLFGIEPPHPTHQLLIAISCLVGGLCFIAAAVFGLIPS